MNAQNAALTARTDRRRLLHQPAKSNPACVFPRHEGICLFCTARRCTKGKNPKTQSEALRLAEEVSWWFQQKFDGRAAHRTKRKYSGINKLGQVIPIDSRLAASLDSVQAKSFLADGEITDSRFYIWDLLSMVAN